MLCHANWKNFIKAFHKFPGEKFIEFRLFKYLAIGIENPEFKVKPDIEYLAAFNVPDQEVIGAKVRMKTMKNISHTGIVYCAIEGILEDIIDGDWGGIFMEAWVTQNLYLFRRMVVINASIFRPFKRVWPLLNANLNMVPGVDFQLDFFKLLLIFRFCRIRNKTATLRKEKTISIEDRIQVQRLMSKAILFKRGEPCANPILYVIGIAFILGLI